MTIVDTDKFLPHVLKTVTVEMHNALHNRNVITGMPE